MNLPRIAASLGLLVLASLAAVACTSGGANPTGTPNGAMTNPTVDGGPATQAEGGSSSLAQAALTCGEIFDCVAGCPESDNSTCEDACVDRGDAEGKNLASAVATCIESNACTDEACLLDKCTSSLVACANQQRGSNTPLDGNVPTGSVPANLTGKWHSFYAPTASTHDFTFNTDGTAKEYLTTLSSFGTCKTGGISDTTGTVVFTDTKFTYYATAGTVVRKTCSKEEVEPAKPSSREYSWSINEAGELVVIDLGIQDCRENPQYSHCITRFVRQ